MTRVEKWEEYEDWEDEMYPDTKKGKGGGGKRSKKKRVKTERTGYRNKLVESLKPIIDKVSKAEEKGRGDQVDELVFEYLNWLKGGGEGGKIAQEFFAASTKGGQRANKKATNVRLRHEPTQITVTIKGSKRSVNKKLAWKKLEERLDNQYKLWEEYRKERGIKEIDESVVREVLL